MAVDVRCKVCLPHPGWNSDDPTKRRDPADTCKACLGSGVRLSWINDIPRPVCQVCGKDTHTEDDHLPMLSLLDYDEPEDPRIGAAEDARDWR